MIENIFKTWWKARKIMKRPRFKWRLRTINNRYGHIRPGNRFISFGSSDVLWKDKYETPRFEYSPQASLWILGKYQVSLELDISEDFEEDQYWEQLVWVLYYQEDKDPRRTLTDEDWEKARNSWPWTTIMKNDGKPVSTWEDTYHL